MKGNAASVDADRGNWCPKTTKTRHRNGVTCRNSDGLPTESHGSSLTSTPKHFGEDHEVVRRVETATRPKEQVVAVMIPAGI